MKECLDEILEEKPDFKLTDFGENAVNEIMERLKQKRTMNNNEIEYLKNLIQRSTEHQEGHQSLVLVFSN